jgi:hypothetical protein
MNIQENIENSIKLTHNKKNEDLEKDSEEKKMFLQQSLSEEYIMQYINAHMPFDDAVIKGLQEHIEDLMNRLYHYENDTQSYLTQDSDISIQSIESQELVVNES